MDEWGMEEQQLKMALQGFGNVESSGRALAASEISELANSAYLLYVSRNPVEKAKSLRMVFSYCAVDAVSVTPTSESPST